jgi:ATP-binding cassette subfamily B protein
VDESIQGVRVVKSFAAETRQIGKLARAAQRLQWAASEMAIVRARFGPLMENVARLSPALLLLYGGMLVIDGSLDGVGTLVTFNTYLMMLQAPFRVLGFFLSVSQRAEASAQRIFELLDEPIAVAERPDAKPLPEGAGHVELRDVAFGYGRDGEGEREPVLEQLSLEARPGETIAIIGRSGSGKSTIARLLLRFYDVRSGAITIDGVDIASTQLASLRASVGYVPEEPFLFSASVHDNIAFGKPDATRAEVEAAARDAMAHEFVAALPEGYDTRVGERGYTLSGGQRQRISLARVLLTNPRILVLDDATSSVDAMTEAAIHRALHERRTDRTTILIAHRESTIRLADRVVLLEDGRAVASGAHEQLLMHEPHYARVLASTEHTHKPLPPSSYAATIDALAAKADPGSLGGLGA